MKNLSLILTFVFSLTSLALEAQTTEMVNRSENIIYGSVVDKSSHWNSDKTLIFTENRVKVNDLFKGDLRDSIITIITPGGMVDDFFQFQTHAIELSKNEAGYFFLTRGNENNYNFVDIERGFCQRDDDLNPKITFNGIQYMQYNFEKMIIKETNLPKVSFSYLRENNFTLRDTDRDSCDVISARHENTIALTVDNIEINGIRQYIEFDVMAKVNTPGLKFGKGFLVLKYSKKIGSNLVSNGSLKITKGNIIKNELYEMTYMDLNTSNVLITIDLKNPSDSVYTFTENTESLLHFRLNLNDFINIEDITKKDLIVMGNLFYYCIDEYSLFDSLIVDGGFQPSNSTSPIGIEYTFENGVVTQNNTKFSIDLYAKATAPSLYSEGIFYINYNDLGFGQNIIDNGTFTFTPKDLIANQSIYHVFLNDFDNNIINLVVYSELVESGYSVLSTQARIIGTLTFSIINCNEEKGINFNEETLISQHIHYVGENSPSGWGELYNPVIATDQENGKICGCDKPVITSFSPTTIHAGTGEILTINGSNFGNYGFLASTVFFRDGDGNGISDMETAPVYFNWDNIVHWNDNQIQLRVPSVGLNSFFKKPASSGQFKVKNKCSEIGLSPDILEIPYSILNVHDLNNTEVRKLIVKETDPNGVVFNFSKSILNTGIGKVIRDAFASALQTWCENTNINFTIGEDTENITASVGDNVNIITYGSCNTNDGVACLTIGGYYSNCNTQTAILNEYDFQVVNGSANGYDYYNRFLHELGHAHMLNHSYEHYWGGNNWSNQFLMYFQSPPYDHQATIKSSDKEGALLVFPNSLLCGSGIGYGSCGTSIVEDIYKTNINIYPNPTSSSINIENKSDKRIFKVQIINLYGETLMTKYSDLDILNFENYPSGIYFAIITLDIGKTMTYKIIKQ
jgi:hypothetical protein